MGQLKLLTMTAIGDARGVCFEYAPRRIIRERNNWDFAYFPHHKFGTGAGRYSDDAQMSLAVAETLLQYGAQATERDFAHGFVTAFKRERVPREGYAGSFFQFLIKIADADEFLARIEPRSDKSGGAMRAGPCGLFADSRLVMEMASRQARVTHNTDDGIAAAKAAALMVHYFLFQLGDRKGVTRYLNDRVPGYDWTRPHKGEVGPKGIDSVRAALTGLVRAESFADLLIDCVNFGGDVDTVAAIASAAAACIEDLDRTIPLPLLEGLEDDAYGRDFLQKIDSQLEQFAIEQGARLH